MFGLSDFNLEEMREIFYLYPEIEEVKIFGSRATGTHKVGSDVDIALFGKNIPRTTLLAVYDKLEEESCIPYYFDLLDYSTLTTEKLKKHIDEVGVLFPLKKVG